MNKKAKSIIAYKVCSIINGEFRSLICPNQWDSVTYRLGKFAYPSKNLDPMRGVVANQFLFIYTSKKGILQFSPDKSLKAMVERYKDSGYRDLAIFKVQAFNPHFANNITMVTRPVALCSHLKVLKQITG